jgi:hypothetical protein
MSVCGSLHAWVNSLQAFSFPFDTSLIPRNGLYFLFEKGEEGHESRRIVRAGTHTGEGQLPSRLCQHFLLENKDRSIFRKNIGRALLNRDHDPFLSLWDLDLTSRSNKSQCSGLDVDRQRAVEHSVSKYIRDHFSFVVVSVAAKTERLSLESKAISTVSLCEECGPSAEWLGLHSPKGKIRDSGLWLVNELYKEPLKRGDLDRLRAANATAARR